MGKGIELYLVTTRGWHFIMAGRKQNMAPMWKKLMKLVDLGEPTSFIDHGYLGCTQREWQISTDIVDNYRTFFNPGATEKLPCSESLIISSRSHDIRSCFPGDALKDNVKQAKILLTITEPCLNPEFPKLQPKNCHARKIWVSLRGLTIWKVMVERYCELANKTTQQLYKVSTPCIDDHHFKEEEMKSVGELSNTCSQIVLKCLYLARIGRPDILLSVNKLARSITKWTKACDKRLNQLISYIHHTCEHKQYCHVGNTAKQCRLWDCFKTLISREILKIRNPHSSFYHDSRTRSTTIGTTRSSPRTPSTSCTSPSSLSRQAAPSRTTLAWKPAEWRTPAQNILHRL